MSIELKDKSPTQDVPKPKAIFVGGVEVGEVKPIIIGDRINWHACIELKDPRFSFYLVQGHGASPRAAIANGITKSRIERIAIMEKMHLLEREIGTFGMSDAELQRLMEII